MYRKYQRLVLEGSNDGVNWVVQEPKMYKRGDVIEEDSKDCGGGGGGGVTEYRWTEVVGEYLCINNDKYKLLKKELYDAENRIWITVYPLETMEGDLIEENSSDCEYGVNWVDTTRFACVKEGETPIPPTSGSLYYSYIDGTESWYSWTKSILSSADNNGSNAKIIIDYDAVITSIPENAFFGCSRLEMISFPNCTYVSNSAFLLGTLDSQTKKLQSFYMPNVQTIGKTAFYGCGFSSLYLPQLLSGGEYCFAYCPSLVSVNLPLVTYLSEGAFCEDANLTSVNLPNLSVVYPYTFQLCQSLYSIRLSNVQTLLSSAFDRCTHLQSATFDVCSLIYEYAFYSCTDLSRITLLSNQVCSLRYSEAFWRTGITSSKGSILVPANLVAAYKSAINWSYFSRVIFPIEG